MDLPLPDAYLAGEVPAACVEMAAADYNLDPLLLLAVMRAENGRVGKASRNRNGTLDYGPMQINSRWLKELRGLKVTAETLRDDGCVNVHVAGWILSSCLKRYGKDYWRGVGCYHSSTRYPVDRNGWYAAKVWKIYEQYVRATAK